MNKTIERYGAAFNLTITVSPVDKSKEARAAAAAKVAQQVGILFNYGVISYIDEQFDPQRDTSIMVQSDAGRLNKGFYALAIANLSRNPKFVAKFKTRKAFLAAVRVKRDQYITRFSLVGTVYENPLNRAAGAYGQGTIHDFGWTQEFSTGA